MPNRRTVLRNVGALAALGGIGTVNARRGGRTQEPAVEDVNSAFKKGLDTGDSEGVKQALRDIGLRPTVETSQDFKFPDDEKNSQNSTESDGTVSAQRNYKDPKNYSDSQLVVATSPTDGNQVWMNVGMTLAGCALTAGNADNVDDAIGVGYIQSDWAPVGEPAVTASDPNSARFTSEDVAGDALAGTVNTNAFQIGPEYCQDMIYSGDTASLTGKFRLREGKEPTTLWGSYTHTKSVSPTGSITSISGGYGGLNVGLNLEASKVWSIAHPTDPRDNI